MSEGAAEEFNGIEGVSAEKIGDDIHVVIEGDVLFDSGKSTLKVASKRSLDRIVTIIKESHAGRSLDVVGFTDTDPIKATKDRFATNYHLGFERAYAVPPPFSLPFLAYRFVWWAACEFYNRIICCGESSALGKCGPFSNHSGNKYAPVDADGDGNMDDENHEWNVGGRLWQLKRERQRVSTLALQNYKKAADEKEDASSDGRLRRIETLVEELLIFSEENEREVLRVAQGLELVRSSAGAGTGTGAGAGSARKRTPKELPA